MEIFPDMGTEWVTQPTSITNPLVRVDMFVYRGKLPEFPIWNSVHYCCKNL